MTKTARVGFMISLAAVTASPAIFLTSLPGLHFGHWYRSEPPLAALHVLGCLAALGLIAQLVGESRAALKALTHPMAALPGLLGACSLVLLPTASSPSASFLGLPETGEGVAWFFDMACLVACGILAQRAKVLKRLALAAMAASAVIVALQSPPLAQRGFAALPLGEYAAFALLGSALAGVVAFRPKGRAYAAACAATLAAVALCGNISATAGLFLCLAAALALNRLRPRVLMRPAAAGLLACLAPVLVTAGHLAATLGGWLPRDAGFSLYSRLETYRVAWTAFAASPWRIATGFGWGAFPDLLVANARAVSGRLDGPTAYGPLVWEGLREPFFQTFSIYLEALLALGPVGLIGWLAWLGLAGGGCPRPVRPRAWPFLAALAVLWGMWFEFPSTAPMIALGMAACAGPRRRPRLPSGVVLAFLGVALCWQALALAGVTRDALGLRREVELIRSGDVESVSRLCDPIFVRPDRGGYYEAALLDNAVRAVRQDPRFALAYLSRLCRVGKRALESDASLRLVEAYVRALGTLAIDLPGPEWEPVRKTALPGWRAAMLKLLHMAPARGDLAAAYLDWSLAHDPAGALAVLDRILTSTPADPVADYFLGLYLAHDRDPRVRAEGLARLRQAKKNGVERFLDIPDGVSRYMETETP